MGQFMSLAESQDEGDCSSEPIGDHAALRAKATAPAAQCLTRVPRSACGNYPGGIRPLRLASSGRSPFAEFGFR